MATKSALTIYKGLLRELSTNNVQFSYRTSPIYQKIKDEFRRHRPIASKHCKHRDEALFVAQTYLSYLESSRHRYRIYSTYAKGERSIEEAAKIVGLALPQTVDQVPSPSK